LNLKTRPGQTYTLQASTNLVDWLTIQTNTAMGCALEFTEPTTNTAFTRSAHSRLFYRMQNLPNP
jgi:hypothetical protein